MIFYCNLDALTVSYSISERCKRFLNSKKKKMNIDAEESNRCLSRSKEVSDGPRVRAAISGQHVLPESYIVIYNFMCILLGMNDLTFKFSISVKCTIVNSKLWYTLQNDEHQIKIIFQFRVPCIVRIVRTT